MGGSYSYLKIKVTNYTAGFIFYHNEKYKKILISAGHPDNSFTKVSNTTSTEYNNYGNWYTFNEDSKTLYDALTEYDPKKDRIDFLLCRLETECDLKKYHSTWDIIVEWSSNVLNIIKYVPFTVLGLLFGCKESPKITY